MDFGVSIMKRKKERKMKTANREHFLKINPTILRITIILLSLLIFSPRTMAASTSEITLNHETYTLKKGKKLKLKASVLDKKYKKKIVWSSKKKKVATVTKKGVVKAVKKGRATIIARIKGTGYEAKCKIIVGTPVKKIVPKKEKLVTYVGSKSKKIGVTINPDNASNTKLTYTSKNEEVAMVNSGGRITGIGVGETDIVVRATDGSNKKAVVHVKVKKTNPLISKFMSKLDEYSAFIKKYGSKCYKNGPNPTVDYEVAKDLAKAGKKIPLNCTAPTNWALREMGYLTTGQIYGTKKGFVITGSDRDLIEEVADFLNKKTDPDNEAWGQCVQKAADLGALKYGDILSIDIHGINHLCVYAGKDEEGNALVYEAGGIPQSRGYELVGCGPLDYSSPSYDDYYISEIIRFK